MLARETANLDPFSRYLRDLQRHPTLTRDEERVLTRRYAAKKDQRAFERLVTGNLRLVMKIAREHCRDARRLPDLVQEGNLGLMLGIRRFDPKRGTRLTTYVAPWIRAYVMRAVLDDLRLVRVGTNQRQRQVFFRLRRERARLERQGIEPDTTRLARRFHMSEEKFAPLAQHIDQGELSLDAPAFFGGSETLGDRIAGSDALRPDAELERLEMRAIVNARIDRFEASLNWRNRILFHQYWRTDPQPTLQALGDRFGISRERVRQIVHRDLARFRQSLH